MTEIQTQNKAQGDKIVELQLQLEELDIPQAVIDKVNEIQAHADAIDAVVNPPTPEPTPVA